MQGGNSGNKCNALNTSSSLLPLCTAVTDMMWVAALTSLLTSGHSIHKRNHKEPLSCHHVKACARYAYTLLLTWIKHQPWTPLYGQLMIFQVFLIYND